MLIKNKKLNAFQSPKIKRSKKLHSQRDSRGAEGDSADLRHPDGHRAAGDRVRVAEGVPRDGPGARGQRRFQSDSKRQLREVPMN